MKNKMIRVMLNLCHYRTALAQMLSGDALRSVFVADWPHTDIGRDNNVSIG